jgi:hypothetical protein
MQPGDEIPVVLGLLNGVEVVTLLSVFLVLFGSRFLADLNRGLGGRSGRRNAIDKMGEEAGRSVGYNYMKPVHDAIAHDNRTVEFHDPRELGLARFRFWKRAKGWFTNFWQRIACGNVGKDSTVAAAKKGRT